MWKTGAYLVVGLGGGGGGEQGREGEGEAEQETAGAGAAGGGEHVRRRRDLRREAEETGRVSRSRALGFGLARDGKTHPAPSCCPWIPGDGCCFLFPRRFGRSLILPWDPWTVDFQILSRGR